MIDLRARPPPRRLCARERRAAPPSHQRPERLPRAGRRHRHESRADDARDRRGARPLDGDDRGAAGRGIQREATMAAKGNSGVILSTIVRGMARVLAERSRSTARVLAQALRGGATSADQAVKIPVEGTMLTVIREMAEEAELPGGAEPARRRGAGARRSSAGTTRSAGRRSSSTSCGSRAWSTRAGRASSSCCAASSTVSPASRCPRRRR